MAKLFKTERLGENQQKKTKNQLEEFMWERMSQIEK